jgi:hypothetical protein
MDMTGNKAKNNNLPCQSRAINVHLPHDDPGAM